MELAALGVPMAAWGARTDEYLTAMRTLWDGTTAFHGRFVSWDDVAQKPRPVQRPQPPIVVGGHSPAVFRRAARHGNGWYGWRLDTEEASHAVTAQRAAATTQDRPAGLGPLEISVTPPQPIDLDMARRYAVAGVHRLVLLPDQPGAAAMDTLIHTAAGSLIGRL